MTTFRLYHAHAFRRWYGKPLTRTEDTLVSHLERQRYLTGRVRAVISVPEADQAIAENILLQYTLYLHRRFWPWCETMVVDTGTARPRRMIKDDSIVFRPGSRNGGTRGFGTFHHVIGLRMDRYGISLKGDPRGWDAIANLRNSVPDVPNTCVLLVGTYRKRSWRAFSSTYRARLQNNNPDHPYICLDVTALPPMQALPVITRTDWLRLARAPRKSNAAGVASVSRPHRTACRRNVSDIASVSKPHAPAAGRYVGSHGIPAGTTSETLSPISKAVTSASRPAQPAPRRGLHQVSRGLRRPAADLPADTSPRKPQPAAWRVANSPHGSRTRNAGGVASVSEPHAPAAGRYVGSHGIPTGTTSETLSPISKAVISAPLPMRHTPQSHPQSACGAIPRLTGCEAARGRAPGKRTDGSQPGTGGSVVMDWPKPSAWQLAPEGISLGRPQIADAFEQPTAPRRPQKTRQARKASEARAIPQPRAKTATGCRTRGRGSARSAVSAVSQGPRPKPTKNPLNSFNPFDSFNLLSLLTFRPFVPKKPPKTSTHAAAAAAA